MGKFRFANGPTKRHVLTSMTKSTNEKGHHYVMAYMMGFPREAVPERAIFRLTKFR